MERNELIGKMEIFSKHIKELDSQGQIGQVTLHDTEKKINRIINEVLNDIGNPELEGVTLKEKEELVELIDKISKPLKNKI